MFKKHQNKQHKKYEGKIIGYAIDLVKFERLYLEAFEYVLGSTLVVDNIDTARRIRNFRVVTLDGDLVEASGVMIGGFYRQKEQSSFGSDLSGENKKLEEI